MTIQTNNNVIITERAEKRVSALLSNEPSGACFESLLKAAVAQGFNISSLYQKKLRLMIF
jgi:Fe-S cluster assembly iron-binding protein IscA